MTNEEHQELAATLKRAHGGVAISGYRCDLMDRLYGDWTRIDAPKKKCHSVKQARAETLWINSSAGII